MSLAEQESISSIVADASRLLGRHLHAVRVLTGGQHAATVLVSDGVEELVVRRFPPRDPAVGHEIGVLERLDSLGSLVPRLVAHSSDAEAPLIVTTKVAGGAPPVDLAPDRMAEQLAAALARIHSLRGDGLRLAPEGPPPGSGQIALAARDEWPQLDLRDRVLTHYDYWCGNALWVGDTLSGVVDWSGARSAPRGQDVAWCRLDFVLIGAAGAVDVFLAVYERQAGVSIDGMAAWDRQAAGHADPAVEEWAPNYYGIGWTDLTADLLRSRFDAWTARLT